MKCMLNYQYKFFGKNFKKIKQTSLKCSKNITSSKEVNAGEIAIKYYTAFNNRDIDLCMSYFSKDIIYEDLVYPEAFKGIENLESYFKGIMSDVDPGLKFCIDDYSSGNCSKSGILWHVEIDGIEMPFSRGCSFVKVNDENEIIFARDLVEPFFKSGDATSKILKFLTPLIKAIGSTEKINEMKSWLSPLWIFYLFYLWIALISNVAPGVPAWEITPDNISILFNESLNFFFIGDFLKLINLNILPNVPQHPVNEALFNFVAAWGLLFLPVMLKDNKKQNMSKKSIWTWWIATMLLTNIFFIPYNIIRSINENEKDNIIENKETWILWISVIGFLMGSLSFTWAFFGRPEFGNLTERIQFFNYNFQNDRVFFAFVMDMILYAIFQASMLSGEKAIYRFIPFIGLFAYNLN